MIREVYLITGFVLCYFLSFFSETSKLVKKVPLNTVARQIETRYLHHVNIKIMYYLYAKKFDY